MENHRQFARTTGSCINSILVLLFSLFCCSMAGAQTFTVLHTFTGGADGYGPYGGVTLDRGGNLYGTTTDNGNPGTVFQLKLRNGAWTLNTLHDFSNEDGYEPLGTVVFGPDGSLYGTTSTGGGGTCGSSPCGTVYNLRPPSRACNAARCPWEFTKLYSFNGSDDGASPGAVNPVFDAAGNLYGTTREGGGLIYEGTVFELSRSGGGWTENILHRFDGGGSIPESGVLLDSAGNIYGTGTYPHGAIFQLAAGQNWDMTQLYIFTGGSDGSGPLTQLLPDAAGNLYGATETGGAGGGGTVYELSPSGGGWAFSVLYSFTGRAGGGPIGPMAMDAAGNLYGATATDGAFECGSVFKLSPGASGWTYTDLHDFTCRGDGSAPYGGVTLDANGNLFGTAAYGGMFASNCNGEGGIGCGVVWEITP